MGSRGMASWMSTGQVKGLEDLSPALKREAVAMLSRLAPVEPLLGREVER